MTERLKGLAVFPSPRHFLVPNRYAYIFNRICQRPAVIGLVIPAWAGR